uniref:hypothetical protein n=1 Tax=Pseudomonas laurentiana TaxID=2364649 RepID=UPI0029C96C9B|nr:hypothetical protein [Pseudomonas laurentiana]
MSALERLDHPVTPLRTDAWAANAPHTRVQYRLQAEAEPDSLCRILNLFALQFLVPQQVHVQHAGELMHIEVQIGGLSWHRAELIVQKMRNLISVVEVQLEPCLPTASTFEPRLAR